MQTFFFFKRVLGPAVCQRSVILLSIRLERPRSRFHVARLILKNSTYRVYYAN